MSRLTSLRVSPPGLDSSRLRIAITADPVLPVPPRFYGGIERVVDVLVRGLTQRGHEVTLFAHPGSKVPGDLRPYPAPGNQSATAAIRNGWHVSRSVMLGQFDLVHSFGRLAFLGPLLPLPVPKLMSYQRPVTPRSIRWGEWLARGSLHFAACSRHLMRVHERRPNWHVVYNGVSRSTYNLQANCAPDAPLVFLGRVEEIKGAHIAIEVARLARRDLVIAGNVPPGAMHRAYFETAVAPHVDNVRVRYVGPVNDVQKNTILGGAAALLMPVLWDEPFGIVMAEALACGTPVIGFDRGSVSEVVRDGINGFLCTSVTGMVTAVSQLDMLDRATCRQVMEEQFSEEAVLAGYLGVYRAMLKRSPDL